MRYPTMFFSILGGFIAFAIVTGAPILGAIIVGLLTYRASARIRTRYRMNKLIDEEYEKYKESK